MYMIRIAGVILAVTTLAACGAQDNGSSGTSDGGGSSSSSSSPSTKLGPFAHAADIHIDACTTDPALNAPVAHLTVTNHSSKASDYAIVIAFNDAQGNQVDTGNAFVQSLQPGQSTKTDANSFKTGVATGLTCKLVQADRLSSVG